uniref:Uncharacterized protein n=1 Tax=Coccolithus braarudii TaxID=221442 RepID=A0A7S0Q7K3_9EUKA|mmetsp:Transcript_43217/g.92047  ORF Transcript_43217/g.92047 Transcript_43217/m.92047 type:complete len:161 (+) Transcript_43217:24-506(+)|eukprot:CAMPEP_0183338946 /NCGR_PEP_ID=MMETSP0164_2-20130417/6059_1 /TAXON_ID=221442 /ORGANISM="Coccolithus pelagicus ssp braarudi, Strain PLY182g" /LENGTH=160 /DNA_ID=CAMNT_0025508873 /DNA_START=24 /DNA_END=506 /DNA_ORIENTATION=-
MDGVPAEITALVSAGDVEGVTKALTPLPEGMSKAVSKKLIKDAQIALKKKDKGGTAAAPAAPVPKAATAPPSSAGGALPAAAAGAGESVRQPPSGLIAGEAEQAIVTDLLSSMQALSLPEEVVHLLRAQSGALCASIAPRVNMLRNQAYSQGYNARGGSA